MNNSWSDSSSSEGMKFMNTIVDIDTILTSEATIRKDCYTILPL